MIPKVTFNTVVSKRGRPVGKALNTMELQKGVPCKNYDKKSNYEKVNTILKWIVKQDFLVKNSIGYNKVTLNDLNVTQKLSCWLYDEKVNFELLKNFMDKNAYKYLCKRIKKEQVHWIYNKCN